MALGRRLLTLSIVAVVIGGAGYGIWHYSHQRQQTQRFTRNATTDGPVPVVAAAAKLADVPVYLDGVGTVRALNTVTVRPQVDGKLLNVTYKEGQDVTRGFVLAQIDPVIYQAAYDQSVAKKAQDEAQLANAKLDLTRYAGLAASNSIARQQYDTQKATVAQFEAQVKLDQAAIDNAKAMLDYTTIRAPIAGRTGIRQVDEGNLVHSTDATGIVVITQLKPIAVLFTLPQQQLAAVTRATANGELPVDVFGADNKTVIDKGVLKVIDNQVDPTTGTIKLKAEFSNDQLQLWPGQFANVRLLINTLKQVVVIPTAAVQRGPNGTFAYTVQSDNKVAVRPVTVAQQDENQAVISRGVNADERVVTTGFARLTAGAEVAVTNAETLPPPGTEPVEQPRRKGRPNGQKKRDQRSEITASRPP
jgi:multidrug efflux system membrane fusion protein